MVSDLRWESFVARDVEVRAADELVRVHALARLDVAEDADVHRRRLSRASAGRRWVVDGRRKARTTAVECKADVQMSAL